MASLPLPLLFQKWYTKFIQDKDISTYISTCNLEERVARMRIGRQGIYDWYYNMITPVAKRMGKPVAPLWLAWIYDIMNKTTQSRGHAEIFPGKLHMLTGETFGTSIFGPGLTSELIMSIVAQLHVDQSVPRDAITDIGFLTASDASHVRLRQLYPASIIRVLYVILATPAGDDMYSAYGETAQQRYERTRQYQMAVSEQRRKNPGTWTGAVPSANAQRWRRTMEEIGGDYSPLSAVPGERAVLEEFQRRNDEIMRNWSNNPNEHQKWAQERAQLVHATKLRLLRMGSSRTVNDVLDIGGRYAPKRQYAVHTDNTVEIDRKYDALIQKNENDLTREQKDSRILYENTARNDEKAKWNREHIGDDVLDIDDNLLEKLSPWHRKRREKEEKEREAAANKRLEELREQRKRDDEEIDRIYDARARALSKDDPRLFQLELKRREAKQKRHEERMQQIEWQRNANANYLRNVRENMDYDFEDIGAADDYLDRQWNDELARLKRKWKARYDQQVRSLDRSKANSSSLLQDFERQYRQNVAESERYVAGRKTEAKAKARAYARFRALKEEVDAHEMMDE